MASSAPLVPDSPPNGQRFLCVVGVMRSGTTILYRLLNNHPQIALTYEADFFALHPLLWPSWRNGAWSRRLDFWNGALSRHGITGDTAATLPARVNGPAEAFQALAHAFAPGDAVAYVGDKSIHYCDCLPEIAAAFPNARFIVLWRPLAEVLDSLHRAGETNEYLAPARRRRQIFHAYEDMAGGVLALRRMNFPVHEVIYRDLVTDPENACRQLCDFLGLAWSPEMLANDPDKVTAIPDQAHHFHARNSRPGGVPPHVINLPASLAATVRSYEQYWTQTFARQGHTLPVHSSLPPGPTRPLFFLERWANRLGYRLHRILIFHKLLVYRYAPFAWLRVYRTFRQRGRAAHRNRA